MNDTSTCTGGVQFTETMRGYWVDDSDVDYDDAFKRGKRGDIPFEFTLTATVEDVEAIIADPETPGMLTGSVRAPQLSPQPLTVPHGDFRLFTRDPDQVGTRNMRYDFPMQASDGREFHCSGFKVLRDDFGFDMWSDTTTLYITVTKGTDGTGEVVGRGVLKIRADDFRKQLGTMRAVNAPSTAAGIGALTRFATYFNGILAEIYGGIFSKPTVVSPPTQRDSRPLSCGDGESFFFSTEDDCELRLRRFQGGTKGPVILAPGFGTSTLAWTLDTVDKNPVEHLYERGYDVFAFDYRASPELACSTRQFTLDAIAEQDWPAAVKEVLRISGRDDCQVLAHCVGSMTFQMARALGSCREVRSAVCSQLTLHSESPTLNEIKSGAYLSYLLPMLGIDQLTTDVDEGNFVDKLLDAALRLYPTSSRVTSATTRRILFMYGEVFDVDKLNQATFDLVPDIFGAANLTSFKQLTLMVNNKHIVNACGDDVYLPHLDKLDLPITFLHGEHNKLFLPAGSQRTYEALCQVNDPNLYKRIVIPDYAHMDCFIGKDADRDVMPLVDEALDAYN